MKRMPPARSPRSSRGAAVVTLWMVGLLLAVGALAGCQQQPSGGDGANAPYPTVPADIQVPGDLKAGETLFNRSCARCHGVRGIGTSFGPPLVHQTYEPNHHADGAFFFAAKNGVQSHHWNFGNMPPLPDVSQSDVQKIVGYIRFLQRQIGIE